MYLQANICNPDDELILDCYKKLDKTIKNETYLSNTKDEKQKFDFLIVPTAMGGSTSIIERLNIRPDLLIAGKNDVDKAIQERNFKALLRKYRNRTRHRRTDIKMGIVQHSYIAGLTDDESVAKELSTIINNEFFIQSVRDPLSLIRSAYNNELVGSGTSKFSLLFSCCNPNSIFNVSRLNITNLKSFIQEVPIISTTNKKSFDVGNDLKLKMLNKSINLAKHYKVGSTYNKYFSKWKTIDIFTEYNKNPGSDIHKIIKLLGADENYYFSIYDKYNWNLPTRLMYTNFIEIHYKKYILRLTLGLAGFNILGSTFPMLELDYCQSEKLSTLLGLKDPIFSLNIDYERWNNLPPDLRQRLIESNFFERFMREILIPHWYANYLHWSDCIRPFFIEKFSKQQLENIRSTISDDLTNFLNVHPEYETTWPSVKMLI